MASRTVPDASRVESDNLGRWRADLTPVGGPRLVPFTHRSQALSAKQAWLETYWLIRTVGRSAHVGLDEQGRQLAQGGLYGPPIINNNRRDVMGMGYASNYADVIAYAAVEKLCPAETEALASCPPEVQRARGGFGPVLPLRRARPE